MKIEKKMKSKTTSIPFGGDIKELGFSVEEWNKSYGKNGTEDKKLKKFYKDQCNEARKNNGLDPL